MKRVVFILVTLLFAAGTTDVQAQWLKKLGQKAVDRAEDRAKKKVEKKVDDAVDKTVDNAFEGAEDAVKGEKKGEKKEAKATDAEENSAADEQKTQGEGQQAERSLEMTYSKSDFVAGDEIIFDDPMTNEQLGEFPSQWDLLNGYAEVAEFAGVKCINAEDRVLIAPLMKDMKNYLPDVFTFEMDYWATDETYGSNRESYYVIFRNEAGNEVYRFRLGGSGWSDWTYKSTAGDTRSGSGPAQKIEKGAWHHAAFSFNKRAFKLYIDGIRVANVPNATPAAYLEIQLYKSVVSYQKTPTNAGITNVRIAKGAVPLYDRMMSDGKFITYGITFDVGKSVIKPESMGEINRIVQLMSENPDLKFSVEGHTDSTGNATSNQTLSEARSKAIVEKLIELGISTDRLTALGKGQTTPIADNGTDEGRAKNRRVEFVKQ